MSETLLRLAEAGHYETVKSLFSFPMKHCPDVLLLALLQINVCSMCYKLCMPSRHVLGELIGENIQNLYGF